MCAFCSNVRRADYNLPGQLIFEIDIPLVINRGLGFEFLAGYTRLGVGWSQKTCEPSRKIYWRRRYSVAVERRLKEEWEVIVELQRVAGANFIKYKKTSVARAHNQRLGFQRTVSQSHAWRKVVFMRGCEFVGIARRPRGNNNSFCVVEIAFVIVSLIEWRGIVVAQPEIKRQLRRFLVVVLNETPVYVLTISEIRDRRNNRRDWDSQQHVCQPIAAAVGDRTGVRGELTAERQVPPRLGNLQKIELEKLELRSGFDQVFPMHPAKRVIQLNVLGCAARGRKQRLAQSSVCARREPSQSID